MRARVSEQQFLQEQLRIIETVIQDIAERDDHPSVHVRFPRVITAMLNELAGDIEGALNGRPMNTTRRRELLIEIVKAMSEAGAMSDKSLMALIRSNAARGCVDIPQERSRSNILGSGSL